MPTKLLKMQLINFKCFENHSIFFNETTIMIGENNAGKSTVIEALRILGLACVRISNANIYDNRPDWLNNKPLTSKGVKVSSRAIDVELEQVFYRYSDPPAVIIAFFENNLTIEIFINSETELFAIISHNNNIITTKKKLLEIGIPSVKVLPQITPLNKNEPYVTTETLARNKFSKRTSRNFRNVLNAIKNTTIFQKFEDVIEKTWSGIRIDSMDKVDNIMFLQLRDRDYVTEIYHMGHGVQMWLQTMWFITNAGEEATIVLDEPDVYMHADLQRRLIRLLKGNYAQTIIATHSVEIMSEVQPNNILIINRKQSQSIFADKYPILQAAISGMGSIHNINLSRLLSNKKYIYVEGDDLDVLKILFDKLFPSITEPLDHIPSVSTGGWGSWEIQKDHAKKLMSEMGNLKVYFLYDRDYHTEDEVTKRIEDAKKTNIYLHIWRKKEIENYLIIPLAISRIINKKNNSMPLSQLTIEIPKIIDDICESIREKTLAKIIDAWSRIKEYRGYEFSTLRDTVLPDFSEKWSQTDSKLALVSGKDILRHLSEYCKSTYGVSFGNKQIASELIDTEISDEVKEFLSAIKEGK